ncbi:ATP-binding protein [Kitasatospora sp. NPDC049285]|uniref:ATP-binding protein n=1 Tax=Kitasatospora sp. NPDC049285 TaxID=3157096 RepID=UPI003413B375
MNGTDHRTDRRTDRGVDLDLDLVLDPLPTRWRSLAVLSDDPSCARAAREMVRRALTDWGLGELADDVELCVSELVGNAARHAAPDERLVSSGVQRQVTVALRTRPCWLFLDVTDQDSRAVPLPTGAAESAPDDGRLACGGRGLQIVRELSDHLCWAPRVGGGKTVSAHFDTVARTER